MLKLVEDCHQYRFCSERWRLSTASTQIESAPRFSGSCDFACIVINLSTFPLESLSMTVPKVTHLCHIFIVCNASVCGMFRDKWILGYEYHRQGYIDLWMGWDCNCWAIAKLGFEKTFEEGYVVLAFNLLECSIGMLHYYRGDIASREFHEEKWRYRDINRRS